MFHEARPIPLFDPAALHTHREPQSTSARAHRLAEQLDEVCGQAELHLQFAVQARAEQQAAWLRLCDRGWPTTGGAEGLVFSRTTAWMDAWSQMVALPVKVWKPLDYLRLRRVRNDLSEAEGALRLVLPAAVWQLVDPLNDTGRATLAFVLQALTEWQAASTRWAAASRIKEALAARFAELAVEATDLGFSVPVAPLDLSDWRRVSREARRDAKAASGVLWLRRRGRGA